MGGAQAINRESILLLLFPLLLLVLPQSAASPAAPFEVFSSWLTTCLDNRDATCAQTLSTLTQFVASETYSPSNSALLPSVPTSLVSQACSASNCTSQLTSSLQGVWATAGSATCQTFGNSSRLPSFLAASKTFLCTKSDTGSSPGSPCLSVVSRLLTAAGLMPTSRALLQPDLQFTGGTLTSACQALVPAAGCCFRTWTLLMSALARQLCFRPLAAEYLALPGRCEVLLGNASVPGPCISGWETTLRPLLSSTDNCSSVAQQQSLAWLDGSACSPAQKQKQGCFSDACGLWCGYMGSLTAAVSGTAEAFPSPPPAPPQQPVIVIVDDAPFNTSVKNFVIAFSAIVIFFVLLFIAWLLWTYCWKRKGGDGGPRAATAAAAGQAAGVDEPHTPTYGPASGFGLQQVLVGSAPGSPDAASLKSGGGVATPRLPPTAAKQPSPAAPTGPPVAGAVQQPRGIELTAAGAAAAAVLPQAVPPLADSPQQEEGSLRQSYVSAADSPQQEEGSSYVSAADSPQQEEGSSYVSAADSPQQEEGSLRQSYVSAADTFARTTESAVTALGSSQFASPGALSAVTMETQDDVPPAEAEQAEAGPSVAAAAAAGGAAAGVATAAAALGGGRSDKGTEGGGVGGDVEGEAASAAAPGNEAGTQAEGLAAVAGATAAAALSEEDAEASGAEAAAGAAGAGATERQIAAAATSAAAPSLAHTEAEAVTAATSAEAATAAAAAAAESFFAVASSAASWYPWLPEAPLSPASGPRAASRIPSLGMPATAAATAAASAAALGSSASGRSSPMPSAGPSPSRIPSIRASTPDAAGAGFPQAAAGSSQFSVVVPPTSANLALAAAQLQQQQQQQFRNARTSAAAASSRSQGSGSAGSTLARPPWRVPSVHPAEAPQIFLNSPQAKDAAGSGPSASPVAARSGGASLVQPAWRPPSAHPNIIGGATATLPASPSAQKSPDSPARAGQAHDCSSPSRLRDKTQKDEAA